MAGKPAGTLLQYWYQWKSMRFPWRKRFLVGLDLQGNTYWEFRLRRGDPPPRITSSASADLHMAVRFRRIVQTPRSVHLSDVKIPPMWHQWLRYQRPDPPSLAEQRSDQTRQARIKVLAAEADKRWEGKERLIDMPESETTQAQTQTQAESAPIEPATVGEQDQAKEQTPRQEQRTEQKEEKPNPWKQAASRGGPSEEWQPQAWTPAPNKRR